MFGYVTPCRMELKIKDYEKFKGYYCGLCKTIKNVYGNLPRLSINFDMTFLAILLDSFNEKSPVFLKEHCIIHPIKCKIILKQNEALYKAAFFNIVLTYYKLLDNVKDDKSISGKVYSRILYMYIKNLPRELKEKHDYIKNKLCELYKMESNPEGKTLDEISDPFANLTAYMLSCFSENSYSDTMYKLGYNLGKWIYIIDALDDLEHDMENNKFNPINKTLNKKNLPYNETFDLISPRIDFLLTSSASCCLEYLNKLPLKKNQDLLYNILQYGLLEKMDKVFKRSDTKNE